MESDLDGCWKKNGPQGSGDPIQVKYVLFLLFVCVFFLWGSAPVCGFKVRIIDLYVRRKRFLSLLCPTHYGSGLGVPHFELLNSSGTLSTSSNTTEEV